MENSKDIVQVQTSVSKEYIAEAVQEVVKSAIINALVNPEELVRQSIGDVLNLKVDRDSGKISNNNWNTMPYIDWLVKKTVEKTVRDCLTEAVQEHQEEFKAAVLHQIRTKKFQNRVAVAFCDTILNSAADAWAMPVTVQFEEKKKYE